MKQTLQILIACIMMLAPSTLQAQKTIYIPSGWQYNSATQEYTQDGYSYSMSRKRESDNFVVFWSSEYGTTAPDQLSTSNFYYVNINDLLSKAESFYKLYAETLQFVDPTKSTTMSKYKCMIMLMHSDEWAAYGSGFDFVVPALWINPATCKPVGHTIAHEVGHSFHYMCFAEGNNHRNSSTVNTGFHLGCGQGQAIWEQTAQWQAAMAYPQYMFSESYPLFGNNANYAFSHEWMRYQSYWFHYYLCEHYNDVTTVAQVWNQPMRNQSEGNGTDFCQALMALKGLSASDFYSLYFDYALRCATFDFSAAASYRNNYIGNFDYHAVQLDENKYQVAYSSAPQSTGFNVIELSVPSAGSTVTTKFTALVPGSDLCKADPAEYNNGNAYALVSAGVSKYNTVANPSLRGFRVGYVFLKSNGTREYYNDETIHCTGTDVVTEDITATVPTGTSRMFLVVTPALSSYVQHKWDDRITNDDQWPYQFELVGTTAKRIAPYIEEPDFEKQVDGRSVSDATLTYNVILPPSSSAYTGATVRMSGSSLNVLCTAFQLEADDIFNRIVNYSAAGPSEGVIMNYAARADGTLQTVGQTTNGDFGHWFNASGTALNYGTGCVAYAEFSKSNKSCVVGQYPGANSNGTKRTIREALRYKDASGKTATVYLVFNITFKTDAQAMAYLSSIEYTEPATGDITVAIDKAVCVNELELATPPGYSAAYTLTDDDINTLAAAISLNPRNLKASLYKGYTHPLSAVTNTGIYYYALDGAPTATADAAGFLVYLNTASVTDDPDFEGLYTHYYDLTGKLTDTATEAQLKVAFDPENNVFAVKASDDCPDGNSQVWMGMARKAKTLNVAYFPISITVDSSIQPTPTGVPVQGIESADKNAHTEVYDLTGRQVYTTAADIRKLPRGIYLVNGQKVLVK